MPVSLCSEQAYRTFRSEEIHDFYSSVFTIRDNDGLDV